MTTGQINQSQYTIGMKQLGKTHDIAENMGIMARLYGRQGELKEIRDEKHWKLILIGCLVFAPLLFGILHFTQDLEGSQDVWGLVALVVMFLFVSSFVFHSYWKEKQEFDDWVERVMDQPNFPEFAHDPMFWQHRRHRYLQKERAILLAEKYADDCMMYELDYELLPDVKLPEGMKLMKKWLFESKNEQFQIAIGEKLNQKDSYMILKVSSEPVGLDQFSIKQGFDVYDA